MHKETKKKYMGAKKKRRWKSSSAPEMSIGSRKRMRKLCLLSRKMKSRDISLLIMKRLQILSVALVKQIVVLVPVFIHPIHLHEVVRWREKRGLSFALSCGNTHKIYFQKQRLTLQMRFRTFSSLVETLYDKGGVDGLPSAVLIAMVETIVVTS